MPERSWFTAMAASVFVKETMIRDRDFKGEKELIEGASVFWSLSCLTKEGRCELIRLRKVVRFGVVNIWAS